MGMGDTVPTAAMVRLSPLRGTSGAGDLDGLVVEQLRHFGIDPGAAHGAALARMARRLYECGEDADAVWVTTQKALAQLDRADAGALFNAQKFLSFQCAKVLDTLMNPWRATYQSLSMDASSTSAKGPYAVFDNVPAIFSASPVVVRTATYSYASAEWVREAFCGKELMLDIYSRLLSPTSVALANHIVDLECGHLAAEYFAWNFSSGMAAIDATLGHVLGYEDVLVRSLNIYGGAFQLIHQWYGKPSNLNVAVETFSGHTAESARECWEAAAAKHRDRLERGRKIYVYLESPCNPQGYCLDVPAICREAHAAGLRVVLDSTVATPFLQQSLQRDDERERPDFVIHSYTKDIAGSGAALGGAVIARTADMFAPKGSPGWENTMFWNVYFVKGAFLDAQAASDIMLGAKTLVMRMLQKCINTVVLATFLDAHPHFHVQCNALPDSPNAALRKSQLRFGLPAPLFTAHIADGTVSRAAFTAFFDGLEPAFSHQISLGQTNSIVSCPALTTHSELDNDSLDAAGLKRTTVRFAVGCEDPKDLLAGLIASAQTNLDPACPGFSAKFMPLDTADALIRRVYLDAHAAYADAKPPMRAYLG